MASTIDSLGTSADDLVERVFGSVLGALDVFSIYLGDRLGYYRRLKEDSVEVLPPGPVTPCSSSVPIPPEYWGSKHTRRH